MKVYKVGGAVRDKLMGLQPKDIDWVIVGSTVSELKNSALPNPKYIYNLFYIFLRNFE